ncbi:hypothetical protein [Halobacillus massiliensis]|nr:hypothetical protein [Halobacillus massiliensis]
MSIFLEYVAGILLVLALLGIAFMVMYIGFRGLYKSFKRMKN